MNMVKALYELHEDKGSNVEFVNKEQGVRVQWYNKRLHHNGKGQVKVICILAI